MGTLGHPATFIRTARLVRPARLIYNPSVPRICLIPRASATGGVTSFQAKLTKGFARRGVEVGHDLSKGSYDAILLTGAVRDLWGLGRARRGGIPIVQRLDGINWLHRRLPTGPRHFLRAEYGNRLLALLRARFVSGIVYQSEFVHGWWRDRFGPERVDSVVIHNGVDLSVYSPEGPSDRPADRLRLLMVEGSLQGGYETGLETGLKLAEQLAQKFPVELTVAGKLAPERLAQYQQKSRVPLTWAGLLPPERIPGLDRSAHALYSADINAACPNSVIEALACGLPVVGFATGALPELVSGDSGRLAAYGGNPWKLDSPDLSALAQSATEVLEDQPRFRASARRRAEEAFGLERMVEAYLQALLG